MLTLLVLLVIVFVGVARADDAVRGDGQVGTVNVRSFREPILIKWDGRYQLTSFLYYEMLDITALPELGAPPSRQGRAGTIQFGTLYESHSDINNPDDYISTIFSITRPLDDSNIVGLLAMYRHNTETGSTGGHSAGVNVMHVFSPRSFALVGYTYTMNDADSTLPIRTDRDRFRIGYFHKLHETKDRDYVLLTVLYNTQTDWSESKTLDAGLSYGAVLSPRLSADLGYRYTRALGDLDMHIYDQWDARLAYKLSRDTSLNIGCLFVNKTYTVPEPGDQPDDDLVFQAGLMYRLH
jgi:opacity protein-like surface antigen